MPYTDRRRYGRAYARERNPVGYAAWYAAELERARARRAEARAGRTCARCGLAIPAERRAQARYCTTECQRAANRPAPRPRRPRQTAAALPPVPSGPGGHPLYAAAMAALSAAEQHELGRDMDSGARDLLQVWVLAELEGADPAAQVRAERTRQRRDRFWLVHGLALVTGLER